MCYKGSCGQHYSCLCRLIIWSLVNHGYHKVLVLSSGLLKLTISYNSDNKYLALRKKVGVEVLISGVWEGRIITQLG